MSQILKWRIYCETENNWQYDWSATAITVCPNDPLHTVTIGSVSEVTERGDTYINQTGHLSRYVSGKEYTIYGKGTDKYIIVSNNPNGDYTTIKSALAAFPSGGVIISLEPGTYVEDNPLILPPNTTISAIGTPSNTIIVAQNPTLDLIHLNYMCKLHSLLLVGASGSGAKGIYLDGNLSLTPSYSLISECLMQDCDIGIHAENSLITLITTNVLVYTTSGVRAKGVSATNTGQIILFNTRVAGIGTPFIPITKGVEVSGTGSKVSLTTSSIFNCTEGLYINDGGELELTLLSSNNNIDVIKIDTTGINSILRATFINTKNTQNYDFNILATDADIEIASCLFSEDKFNNPNNIKMRAHYNTNVNGKRYQVLTGDIHIGSNINPSKMSVGAGNYNNIYITVLTNDNLEIGTWTNYTTESKSSDGSIFNLFSGTSVGNCLYLGCNSSPRGAKINVTNATSSITPYSDLIYEYWDGTNWISFNIMCTNNMPPYSGISDAFISIASKLQLRFSITNNTPVTSKILNSISAYWIRIRVINILSSIPQAEYIKLHTNNLTVHNNGHIVYFGDARPNHEFKLDIFNDTNMQNQQLYLTQNISVSLQNNKFNNTTLSRLGSNIHLPKHIDLSFPIKIKYSIVGDITFTGNIRLILRWNNSNKIYYNSIDAPVSTNNTNESIISLTTKDTIYNGELIIGLYGYTFNSTVLLSIERDPSHINDTYTGNISLVTIEGVCKIWSSGSHVLSN